MMEIRFLSLANREVDEAVQWYERARRKQEADGSRQWASKKQRAKGKEPHLMES